MRAITINKKRGKVYLILGKNLCLVLAAFILFLWRPCLISSAPLYMTSYYPAPYGGYDRLFTSKNAYLAYDSGIFMWGKDSSYFSTDQGGSIYLKGSDPKIVFRTDKGNISLSGQRLKGITMSGGDLLLEGSIRKICYYLSYSVKTSKTYCGGSLTSSKNYIVLPAVYQGREVQSFGEGQDAAHTFDDGTGTMTPEFPLNGGSQDGYGSFVTVKNLAAFPVEGNMLCCRFSIE